MKQFQRWLEGIWFPELAASRLAILRILTGLFVLWYAGSRYSMLLKIASTERALFEPVGVVSWLSAPLPLAWVQALVVFTLAANVAFIAGWQYRIVGPAFGLSLLTLLCYRNSWSMIYHSDNAMVVHVLILGFARAADVFSLDSFLRQKKGIVPPQEPHWRYGWPVQLMCAATLSTYFLSGAAKLFSSSGLAWIFGESLRSQVAVDAIRKELLGAGASQLAFTLYDQVWLFTLLGAFSLVVELFAPLAFLHPRLGYLWAANTFLMHWGIFFLMSITFRYQLTGFLFLSFLPLEQFVRVVWERTLAGPKPGEVATIVVIDGKCRFCLAQMRLLRLVDLFRQLRFVSLHDEVVSELVPGMSPRELMEKMVVRTGNGSVYTGALAVRCLFRKLPLLWWGAPLLHLPGSLPLWNWAYEQIARRRYLLAGVVCSDGSCSVPGIRMPEVGQGVSHVN
jgi:predicted DCC family thiol-disulfide oxidoreductase YuxK